MFKNFILITFRGLWRHKVHSLIGICSLAIGLAIFSMSLSYVNRELTVNESWPQSDGMLRLLVEQRGLPRAPDGIFDNVAERGYHGIREYFAEEIESISRLFVGYVVLGDAEESFNLFNFSMGFVDPGFTDIFRLEVVEGDLARALASPGFIALEESTAEQLGESAALGNTVTLRSSYSGEQSYEVAAIYRLPDNNISPILKLSSLTLINDYSLPLFVLDAGEAQANASWQRGAPVWVRLKPGVDLDSFNAMQSTYIEEVMTAFNTALGPDRRISDHLLYEWQPVTQMYFNPADRELGNESGDIARVWTFAVVGLLVLLVGISNTVSLGLATAIERQREIGVRKTTGAQRWDITRHYLGESVVLALLALVPAFAIIEWAQPLFFNMLPFPMELDFGGSDYALLSGIALLTGLISGAYPALVLSGVKPQSVLRPGGAGVHSGTRLRTLLVGTQFSLAALLIITTCALYAQLSLTRAQPLGFNPDNLIVLNMNSEQEQANANAFRQELSNLSGVIGVVTSTSTPNTNLPLGMNAETLVRQMEDRLEVEALTQGVGFGFLEMMEIPLLAGRHFDPEHDPATLGDNRNHIIINRTAARTLGFTSPEEAVGQTVRRIGVETLVQIIGVVEDNMYASFHRRPVPEIYQLINVGVNGLMLRYNDAVEGTIADSIRTLSERINGFPVQNVGFLGTLLERAFAEEEMESRILLICGVVTLLLASMGLYGLAAFVMEKRVKEVGIRKVLGASVREILSLFLWRFSKPVLIANLLAWPIAVYFILQWVKQFPYQMEPSWLLPICLGASLLVLLISLLTMAGLTVKAANTKPVRSLRYE